MVLQISKLTYAWTVDSCYDRFGELYEDVEHPLIVDPAPIVKSFSTSLCYLMILCSCLGLVRPRNSAKLGMIASSTEKQCTLLTNKHSIHSCFISSCVTQLPAASTVVLASPCVNNHLHEANFDHF